MSTPCEPRQCALHVLVADGEGPRPDPTGLLDALGDQLAELTVVTLADATGDVPRRAVELAADVLDELAARTGRPVRYTEVLHGEMADALRHRVHRGIRTIVAVPAGAPRRTVRAVRRATDRADGHVAVVPTATVSPTPRRRAGR